MMQRFPTAKYLGTCVCLWGTVVACTSAANSYASLAALRFLLGMFESAISPASSSSPACGTNVTSSLEGSGRGILGLGVQAFSVA